MWSYVECNLVEIHYTCRISYRAKEYSVANFGRLISLLWFTNGTNWTGVQPQNEGHHGGRSHAFWLSLFLLLEFGGIHECG